MSSFQWNVVILTFRQILEGGRRVGRREREEEEWVGEKGGGEIKGRLGRRERVGGEGRVVGEKDE